MNFEEYLIKDLKLNNIFGAPSVLYDYSVNKLYLFVFISWTVLHVLKSEDILDGFFPNPIPMFLHQFGYFL